MEAINRAERTTSLINFIVVYAIVLAIPLMLAFFAGTRKSSGVGSPKAVSEQIVLSKRMADLQQNIVDMRSHDQIRANAMSSPENWQDWLSKAESQNEEFKKKVSLFRDSREFTDARSDMRYSACAYLDMVAYERGVHIANLKTLRGERNEAATIEQLKAQKEQLQAEKSTMQNQLNTLNALLAQKPAGGGGGAQPDAGIVADLKWQLRFKDADCNKKQADLLAAYHEADKRKKLYTSAKVNFQQIAQLARNSYMLQQSASEKVREIDQQMSSL